MTYECRPADRDHYATSLTLEPQSNRLTWTALPGQDSLLLQTPYGVDPAREPDALRDLLERLCSTRLPQGRFHTLSPSLSVRYVDAEEKARNQGCRANGEACTYTVFPCVTDIPGDLCRIYVAGGRDSMSSPRCDVPMNIRAEVTPVRAYTGYWLFRRETSPEFFRVRFPDPCPENYRNGDLEYGVGERWRIPVTKEMIERGEFFVRTDRKPVLIPRNAGVRLSEPRRER
ncbi:MAG: hypothetical protein IJR54_08830 [Oscillibacter sp.]|nr:hypothetical protein [Oscillibacter sp.]